MRQLVTLRIKGFEGTTELLWTFAGPRLTVWGVPLEVLAPGYLGELTHLINFAAASSRTVEDRTGR